MRRTSDPDNLRLERDPDRVALDAPKDQKQHTEKGEQMSLKDNYDSAINTDKQEGVVERWFAELPQEDKDFIISKVKSGEQGWKTALWRASRKSGLTAGLTSFKMFLEELEA